MEKTEEIKFKAIGLIKTPYIDTAPYQPIAEDKGDFRIVLNYAYANGLLQLDKFSYMYVIYYIDQLSSKTEMIVHPPWSEEEVGLFASRSPMRPNPLGISIVKIKNIEGNEIITSGLDVFNNTPVLDIKPYIKDLDSKEDANYGWIQEGQKDKEHLLLHIQGIPHDY